MTTLQFKNVAWDGIYCHPGFPDLCIIGSQQKLMCFCGSKELAEKTPTPFVHLHNHSDYSLLDGASRIDRMVDTALSMGMPALALTDHGNLYGALQFYNTARKKGLKPIIGCEIYVAKESRHKKTGGGDQSNHLVLLAENLTGYHNLSRLASYGFIEGFYYKPRIDKELLSQYHEGLIALSACLKGAVPQKLAMGEYEGAVAEALELRVTTA